jgi:hypothetical protein
MAERIWENVEPTAETPLQFGIRDLLIAQAVCAACLGLFATVGVVGLMLTFLGTLAFCALPAQPHRTKLKRCIIDLMGGIVLPALFILCLCNGARFASDPPTFTFVAIAFQMLALLVWLIAGARLGRFRAVFAGVLFVGSIISGVLASTLFFLGVLGMTYYGIGVVFFIPILTCYAFLGSMAEAMRQARARQGRWTARLLFWLGIACAFAIPMALEIVAGRWIGMAISSTTLPRAMWFGDLLGTGR